MWGEHAIKQASKNIKANSKLYSLQHLGGKSHEKDPLKQISTIENQSRKSKGTVLSYDNISKNNYCSAHDIRYILTEDQCKW
jgi:hypothetical protein